MKPRLAIIAALPRELAPLVRQWPVRRISKAEGTAIYQCENAVAVCAGMGGHRAEYAVKLAAESGPLGAIVSAGYAGALRKGIAAGTVHWPTAIVDGLTGERFDCAGEDSTLLTTDRVITREDKPGLAARWSAELVDMEAAAVVRCAARLSLPFRVVKVVSDEEEDLIPDLTPFVGSQGEFREWSYAAHLALHPREIPATVRLGRRSALCSRLLAQELRRFIRNTE